MRITEDAITGETTKHMAHRVGDVWTLTWLPGRLFPRTQAITGMTIAEILAREEESPGAWMWSHINQWAAELGLTGREAAARVAQPPHGG